MNTCAWLEHSSSADRQKVKSENTPPALSISLPQRKPLQWFRFCSHLCLCFVSGFFLKLYRKNHGIKYNSVLSFFVNHRHLGRFKAKDLSLLVSECACYWKWLCVSWITFTLAGCLFWTYLAIEFIPTLSLIDSDWDV